jgi:hypothetical protein
MKMKMLPASRNWENHLRCLAAAISLRGTDRPYSENYFRLLAASRLLIVRRVRVRLSLADMIPDVTHVISA